MATHQWRKQARGKGIAVLGGKQEVERWSTQNKFFLIVMEVALLSEVGLASIAEATGFMLKKCKHGVMPEYKPLVVLPS